MNRLSILLLFVLVLNVTCILRAGAEDNKEPTYNGQTASQWIETLKKTDSSKTRLRAVESLGALGPSARNAVALLEEIAKNDSNRLLKRRAGEALKKIQGAFSPLVQTQGRLGVEVKVPPDELVSQLDLPENQGLVIEKVSTSSAAEKVGIKLHDVLLEIDDQKVTNDLEGLARILEQIKAGQAVEVMVLRKGTFEELKGLSLPKVTSLQGLDVLIEEGNREASYSIQVRRGKFFGRYSTGERRITVQGTMENGRAQVTQIVYVEGRMRETYKSLDDVPQKQRRYVKKLLPMNYR